MDMNTSKIVEDFSTLIEKAKRRYQWAYEQVGIEEKLENDLRHAIELNTEGARKRNQLAKEFETCLRDRRYYKDIVEEMGVIVEFVNKNNKSMENLKQMLGELRKAESYHACRTYHPRVRRKGEEG